MEATQPSARKASSPVPRRIVVIGTSGSGKSTFARRLARALRVPHVELDALHWEAHWVPAPVDVFRQRVARAIASPAWVVDGNYGKVRDATWSSADALVWLDYPFHVTFGRALFRTLRRAFSREQLWNGNRESIRMSFFSRQSILVWVLQSYQRKRREIPELLSRPAYSRLDVLRFRDPEETEAYLRTVEARSAPAS